MNGKGLTKTPRIRKLRSLTDCCREIAFIYGLSRKGEVSTQDMGRWVVAINTLAGLLKDEKMISNFQERLDALENQ